MHTKELEKHVEIGFEGGWQDLELDAYKRDDDLAFFEYYINADNKELNKELDEYLGAVDFRDFVEYLD